MVVNANDFIVGFDPTGSTSITGAQLATLVNSAVPQVDKGMAILTTDVAGNPEVPDAAVTTKWQRYLWIRQSVSSVGLYVWNDNAATDATYLKWVSVNIAGIGAGSIVDSMIADNTITDVKIANLSYSKLIGAPSGLAPSGAAGGDLTGTYPNPSVAADAITTSKILNSAVTAAKVETAASATTGIDYTKLRGDGVAGDMLRAKADYTQEWFVPNAIVQTPAATLAVAANALKILRVNSASTAYELVSPAGTGARLLQQVITSDATGTSGATTMASNALPTTASGNAYAALDTAITPISATSTLVVEVLLYVASGNAVGTITGLALFDSLAGTPTNAVAVGCTQGNVNASACVPVMLRYSVVSGATTARTFSIRFGNDGAGTSYATKSSAGALFGGAVFKSSVKITEYL